MNLKSIDEIGHGKTVFLQSGSQADITVNDEGNIEVDYYVGVVDTYTPTEFNELIKEGILIFEDPSQLIMEAEEGTVFKQLKTKEDTFVTAELKIQLQDTLNKLARQYPDVKIRQKALSFLDALNVQEYNGFKKIKQFANKYIKELNKLNSLQEDLRGEQIYIRDNNNVEYGPFLNQQIKDDFIANAHKKNPDATFVEVIKECKKMIKSKKNNVKLPETQEIETPMELDMESISSEKEIKSLEDSKEALSNVEEIISSLDEFISSLLTDEEMSEDIELDLEEDFEQDSEEDLEDLVLDGQEDKKDIEESLEEDVCLIEQQNTDQDCPRYIINMFTDDAEDDVEQLTFDKIDEAVAKFKQLRCWKKNELVDTKTDEILLEINCANESFEDNMGMLTSAEDLDIPDAFHSAIDAKEDGALYQLSDVVKELKELKTFVQQELQNVKNDLKLNLQDLKQDLKQDFTSVEDRVEDTQDAIEDTQETLDSLDVIDDEVEEETELDPKDSEETELDESITKFCKRGYLEDLEKTKQTINTMASQKKSVEEIKDAITLMSTSTEEEQQAGEYAVQKLKENLLSTKYSSKLSNLHLN